MMLDQLERNLEPFIARSSGLESENLALIDSPLINGYQNAREIKKLSLSVPPLSAHADPDVRDFREALEIVLDPELPAAEKFPLIEDLISQAPKSYLFKLEISDEETKLSETPAIQDKKEVQRTGKLRLGLLRASDNSITVGFFDENNELQNPIAKFLAFSKGVFDYSSGSSKEKQDYSGIPVNVSSKGRYGAAKNFIEGIKEIVSGPLYNNIKYEKLNELIGEARKPKNRDSIENTKTGAGFLAIEKVKESKKAKS